MAVSKTWYNCIVFLVVSLPDLRSSVAGQKLSRGMGHNPYGEPAWPNDILYIFPAAILDFLSTALGASTREPANVGGMVNPSATPLEILPEQCFYSTFSLLRILPDKPIGVLSLAYIPSVLSLVPIIENSSRSQSPLRRPLTLRTYLFSIWYSFWLGIGSLVTTLESLPLP